MQYNEKGQESPVKGHNFEFLPRVFKFRALRMLHLLKQDVVLKVLTENKVFHISKRAEISPE